MTILNSWEGTFSGSGCPLYQKIHGHEITKLFSFKRGIHMTLAT
jgi:hypothetical protein